MKRLLSALVVLTSLCVLPANAQDFMRGYLAYSNGNFAKALREWRPLALRGSSLAQYNLGRLYLNGEGVPQNYGEALRWFNNAASQQYAPAQNSLGLLYSKGLGVRRDPAEAVKWFRHSAEQGYAPGQVSLGLQYAAGKGVPRDSTEAMKWFSIAAELGNQQALGYRDELAPQLKPEQAAVARQMASVWLLRNER